MKINMLRRLTSNPTLNFLITNRIPRKLLTIVFGKFSRIRSPALARLSIAIWRRFTDLDLSDSAAQSFDSVHACFTRRLVPGARPIDNAPAILVSPCDAIVGAFGQIDSELMLQAKGMSYTLGDLLGPSQDPARFEGGTYITLRLTSSMYHRFHSPAAIRVRHVTYISGDAWNVNPAALERIPRLFCRNERAIIEAELQDDGTPIVLVPVAAVLVASIRLSFADVLLHLRYRGPNEIVCDHMSHRGDELGWFEHGSTIIVIAPAGFEPVQTIERGRTIRMGNKLFQRTQAR